MSKITQPPPAHPAEFSSEVLDVIAMLLANDPPARVHDPFAGRGLRLGALCDSLGIAFSGTDIEQYRGSDPRVVVMDAANRVSYPRHPFTIVTSPVYFNRISTDYVNGPTPNTKRNGRRAYGISLGRALHEDNYARLARDDDLFYAAHSLVVKHWHKRALVNVDLPMLLPWHRVLVENGYVVYGIYGAHTRRYRGLANDLKRADYEVVLEARR